MNTELIGKFKELMEKGTILQGRVKLVQFDKTLNSDILLLDLNGVKAIIKKEDFDVKVTKQSLVPFVGAVLKFVIIDITEDGTLLCSRKLVKELERDVLIEKMEESKKAEEEGRTEDVEVFEGKIVNIQKFGAYLNVKGTTVVLKNIDFSIDYTSVADLHKVGDVVKVKLNRVTSTKKILVEAVEKYCNPTSVDFSTFSSEQVVLGRIRTIKPWGCYVCIAPNLDALAPVPDLTDYEVEEGMSVLFKIKQVIPATEGVEGRVRGKILEVVKDDNEFYLD